MNAYSQNLRKRIVKAVETSGNQTQVAITFHFSRSTIRRMLKLEKVDPSLADKPIPGRHPEIAAQNYPAVMALLQERNDGFCHLIFALIRVTLLEPDNNQR